jgi:hypothetical protein
MRLTWRNTWMATFVCCLAGCATPYEPPVVVHGSSAFPGIADVVGDARGKPVDIILVHGMCTKGEKDGQEAITKLVNAIDRNVTVTPSLRAAASEGKESDVLEIETKPVSIAGGTARFSALVWSPLTTPLKRQLYFDKTGEPTDCESANVCTPVRAKLNGKLKDTLLNDCLADAMIYQGTSRDGIRQKMSDAISRLIERARIAARDESTEPGPLILVSFSLGSKIAFDALEYLTVKGRPTGEGAVDAIDRLSVIYMGANQLPILHLSEQNAITAARALTEPADSLQRVLRFAPRRNALATRTVVSFTDPNDLLSYRLLSSRYASSNVAIADVLVSNDNTYVGLLESPYAAHLDYDVNDSVNTLIACGWPKRSKRCKQD